MAHQVLKIHPDDNVIVALQTLKAGQVISLDGESYRLTEDIPAKHKFTEDELGPGDPIRMYGVLVGKATQPIAKGARISTENVQHQAEAYDIGQLPPYAWTPPDSSRFEGRTFMGYRRSDGQVGTRNYWLVIPLVFCKNRNLKVIEEAMLAELGYLSRKDFAVDVRQLVDLHRQGAAVEDMLEADIVRSQQQVRETRVFPHVDGIKFLRHDGGCGGTRQDSDSLINLLAGYVTHPNVAGATILSLGCQHAQASLLQDALHRLDPNFAKPIYVLEQQKIQSERAFIASAVKQTFVGLVQANQVARSPAPLSALKLGLECGGSDGFSGISANPALGYTSDLLVALGGTAILAEFPELNGVEQELVNRSVDRATAEKFVDLMRRYAARAEEAGSGFDMNPSPGNIRDGLITDAIKSAGAAKKGGSSPVTAVLDYTEPATQPGLNLLCTPGNDVESTTGLAGSWANLIVFTSGLGTPTGNPVAPVIKFSSNTALAKRMSDLIDLDAGSIISGEHSIAEMGEELLELIIQTASGTYLTRAEKLGQDDFIPWKRGVSL